MYYQACLSSADRELLLVSLREAVSFTEGEKKRNYQRLHDLIDNLPKLQGSPKDLPCRDDLERCPQCGGPCSANKDNELVCSKCECWSLKG